MSRNSRGCFGDETKCVEYCAKSGIGIHGRDLSGECCREPVKFLLDDADMKTNPTIVKKAKVSHDAKTIGELKAANRVKIANAEVEVARLQAEMSTCDEMLATLDRLAQLTRACAFFVLTRSSKSPAKVAAVNPPSFAKFFGATFSECQCSDAETGVVKVGGLTAATFAGDFELRVRTKSMKSHMSRYVIVFALRLVCDHSSHSKSRMRE